LPPRAGLDALAESRQGMADLLTLEEAGLMVGDGAGYKQETRKKKNRWRGDEVA
jgi:hypothetical protein